ncbi:MAG TPA: GNAT family N-acetyltransferase [Dehalococcoidia bacterium]|nr:GNAT family N-acetyltransferase [Dehalococcoidia bacterium]
MNISVRAYRRKDDFERVGQFLLETYRPGRQHSNWLQSRWEYMHYHPLLDESALPNIGIWESDGSIAGVAHYEDVTGSAFFQIHPGFAYLKLEMLLYAENHLYKELADGRRYLGVFINNFDSEFESIAAARGYKKLENPTDAWSAFVIPHPFPEIILPAGFRLRSLQDDNDLKKLDRVLHRGFNHPGEPPADGIEGRRKMQSAPNYNKDLNIFVEAPGGSYGAYCGMWYLEKNGVAMVEPVCTDPDYRRMGLGRAAVLEGIRRCGELGATVAYVGSQQDFYLEMGFELLFTINFWAKYLES